MFGFAAAGAVGAAGNFGLVSVADLRTPGVAALAMPPNLLVAGWHNVGRLQLLVHRGVPLCG